MLKQIETAGILAMALMAMSGAAQANQISAGTLNVAVLFSPVVDTAGDTVTLGGAQSYFSGTGSFNGFSGNGTTSAVMLSFANAIGGLDDYSSHPIKSFITFQNAGDTYSFSIDDSIRTENFHYVAGASGNGTIALYMLGNLTDSEGSYVPTPAAFTLTLNETGGSAWSASATLATPPNAPTDAPEPASMVLLGSGLAALGYVRRRGKA